jgi:hypothetical protein
MSCAACGRGNADAGDTTCERDRYRSGFHAVKDSLESSDIQIADGLGLIAHRIRHVSIDIRQTCKRQVRFRYVLPAVPPQIRISLF